MSNRERGQREHNMLAVEGRGWVCGACGWKTGDPDRPCERGQREADEVSEGAKDWYEKNAQPRPGCNPPSEPDEVERAAPFEYVELCNMVLVLQPPYTQDKIDEIQQAAERAAAIRRGEGD